MIFFTKRRPCLRPTVKFRNGGAETLTVSLGNVGKNIALESRNAVCYDSI